MRRSRHWNRITATEQHRAGTFGPLTRRRALGVFGGTATVLLGACSNKRSPGSRPTGQTGATNPTPGGVLNIVALFNAQLDPQLASAAGTQVVAGAAMSRLFRFKSAPDSKVALDHTLENDLALSAESPDATTWTIKLRPDAKFQNMPPVNGRPVEAEDIKASFSRFVTEPRNPNRGALSMIEPDQIETPSKDTVVFHLTYPFAPFPNLLSSSTYAWILPREGATGVYDTTKQLIGSGPYVLDSYTPDVAYVFKRNADWFEKGRPYVDDVHDAIIPDSAQQLAQFQAGNLDEIAPGVNDLDTLKRGVPNVEIVSMPPTNSYPIFFQLGDTTSAFQDIRVRQAFSMAIDRDALGTAIWGNRYQSSIFVPPSMGRWALTLDDLDPGVAQFYKYNPAEAKKLLQAAGATSLSLKLVYILGGFSIPAYRAQAQAVGQMLDAAGIKTQLVEQDYLKDFIAGGHGSRQGNFEKDAVVFAGIPPLTDVDELLFNYFHSKSTSNQERLKDPQLDGMIDKARTVVNETDRLKAYKDIQKYLAAKVYAPGTTGGTLFTAVQPRVQNYSPSTGYGAFPETYSKLWLGQK